MQNFTNTDKRSWLLFENKKKYTNDTFKIKMKLTNKIFMQYSKQADFEKDRELF